MKETFYSEDDSKNILYNVNQNAYDYMSSLTSDKGGLISMTYFDKELSYEELKNTINLYANRLKSFGLSKGDVISIILPNIPDLVFYKYAAWKLGIIVNLIEPRFNPSGISEMIGMCHSKLLITTGLTYNEKIKSVLNEIKVEKVVLVNPTKYMSNLNFQNLLAKLKMSFDDYMLKMQEDVFKDNRAVLQKDFIKNIVNDRIDCIYEENMPASIIFTSGTSGFPKGAVFSHEAYNTKTNQISYALTELLPGDRFLAAIPFFAAYGSFAGMHTVLSKGMNMIMIPKFKTEEYGDLVCKYNIQTTIGVPKHWDEFCKHWPELQKKYKLKDLSFLKYPVTGGDIIAPQVIMDNNKLYKENNSTAKLIVGYGSTETGGPICTTVSDSNFDDSNTTGVLLPGVDYILVDEETHEILENSNVGEIAIYDPAAMLGYLDNDEATNDIIVEHNGKKYYRMGDIVEMNDKGMLYFKGRVKRAIMRPDGHTVHSLPIEQAIMKSGIVDNVCTVGIKQKNQYSGAIPVAFIVLKEGINVSDDTIQFIDKVSLDNLPERNRALAYVFVDKLPYTLMGKVDYRSLEKKDIETLELYPVDYTFFQDRLDIAKKVRKK